MEIGNGKERTAGKLELIEWLKIDYIKFKYLQVGQVEVEFSDKHDLGPLTVAQLMSLLFINGLFLAIAIVVWLGGLWLGFAQKTMNHTQSDSQGGARQRPKNTGVLPMVRHGVGYR